MSAPSPEPSNLTPAKVAEPSLVARVRSLLGQPDGRGGLWSRNSIAKQMGENSATLSTWLAQYDDAGAPAARPPELKMNLSRFEATVEDFLATLADRRDYSEALFETALTRDFHSIAGAVRAIHGIGVYYSGGGQGKTSAIAAYQKANPLALTVPASTWRANAAGLLQCLFEAANRSGRCPRSTSRALWLMERLAGTERVLIIDSYHRLTLRGFQFLFDLHDETKVPILLVGNISGLERIEKDTQLYTRVFLKREATWGDSDSTRAAAWRDAADRLLQRDAPDHAQDIRSLARQVVTETKGGLRELQKHLILMREFMRVDPHQSPSKAFHLAHDNLLHGKYTLRS